MNKLLVILCLLGILMIDSCREDIIEFPEDSNKGTIFLDSTPPGASIFLGDTFTGKITPNQLPDLDPGDYTVKLKLPGYADTAFVVNLVPGGNPYKNVRMTR